MSNKTSEYFITGGQTLTHNLRMVRANLKSLSVFVLALFLVVSLSIFFTLTTFRQSYNMVCWYTAYVQLSLPGIKDRRQATQFYKNRYGRSYERRDIDILRDVRIFQDKEKSRRAIGYALWVGLITSLLAFVGMIIFFIVRGRKKHETQDTLRGAEILTPSEICKRINKEKAASDLNVAGVPLIKNKETQHIMFSGASGASGTGKTMAMNVLVEQIRGRGDRGICVDNVGSYIEAFYREGDIIINPFDERSEGWSPWGECVMDADFDALAAAIVPPTKKYASTSYWEESAKEIIACGLRTMKERDDARIEKLIEIFFEWPVKKFVNYFEDTTIRSYLETDSGKGGFNDLKRTINNHLKFLKNVNDDNPFSIRQWVTSAYGSSNSTVPEGQWIWMVSNKRTRETVRPLYSCMVDVALSALQDCQPDKTQNRRLWYVLDELPSMKTIPSLESGLTEIRKYGGCIMAGFQNFAQLKQSYGDDIASSMLDQFATRFYFRSSDPTITSWIQRSIGEKEVIETTKSESYGAHHVRDGQTIAKSRKTLPAVMASEISTLPTLTCFLKLPEFGITKINIPITKRESKTAPFKMKDVPIEIVKGIEDVK